MKSHEEHFWVCSDIPGMYYCEVLFCRAIKYFSQRTQREEIVNG